MTGPFGGRYSIGMRHVIFGAVLLLAALSMGLNDVAYSSAIAIAAWRRYGGTLNARVW